MDITVIKNYIMSNKILYETFFFLTGKKINTIKLDKKIKSLQSITLNKRIKIPKLIVSLTSFGERLTDLKYTLYSLIKQSILPEKIIVWLAYGEIIPSSLKIFELHGVEFAYCEDLKSYKKLIPTLKRYSDYCIVTADDDIYYKRKWLEKLWKCHLKNPDKKVVHIAHKICFDKNQKLMKYTQWKHNVVSKSSSMFFFPTGCGGILYPPNSAINEFLNSNTFLKYCPNADDVWFYFMGILLKQEIIIVPNPINHLKYVDIYKEYGLNNKTTLQKINVENNMNDVQIKNLMEYFSIDDSKLYNMCLQKN